MSRRLILIYFILNSTQINSQAFPYPAYPKPKELNHIVPILPVFLMLGFVLIVPSIIRNIVSEKETGVKVK